MRKINLSKINDFLDNSVLPYPVKYLTNRFVILLTIGLLAPLLYFADHQTFVLAANSYLNSMSVAVSSIVLLYAAKSEITNKCRAEAQEQRAQEDHTHTTEIHQLLLNHLVDQQNEMEIVKQILIAHDNANYEPKVVQTTDIKDMHPRGQERFEKNNGVEILQERSCKK